MTTYERFLDLHAGPDAFVMPNPWDGASAFLLKRAGFAALGTSSAALAFALGRRDGAHAVSRTEAIEHAGLLQALTGLPVNGDLEDGFGPSPADCVTTVEASIAAGLAGLGIEDTTADPAQPLHSFDDAVARSAYPIDIHNPSGTGTTTFRLPPGASYEIPYRCLVPERVERLLVAGRCISTTHEALASVRLTPTVMTLGQAAGTAAAHAASNGAALRAIDAAELRAELVRDGVDLRR